MNSCIFGQKEQSLPQLVDYMKSPF